MALADEVPNGDSGTKATTGTPSTRSPGTGRFASVKPWIRRKSHDVHAEDNNDLWGGYSFESANNLTRASTSPVSADALDPGVDGRKFGIMNMIGDRFKSGSTNAMGDERSTAKCNTETDSKTRNGISSVLNMNSAKEKFGSAMDFADTQGRKLSASRIRGVVNREGSYMQIGDTNNMIGESYRDNISHNYYCQIPVQKERIIHHYSKEQIFAEPDNPNKWMSESRYQEHQQCIYDDTVKDSGKWLLKTAQYNSWITATESSCLWIHGKEGVGKTALMSIIAAKIMMKLPQPSQATRVAYFYCSSREKTEPGRSRADDIMRTITLQLCKKDDGENADVLINEYKKRKYQNLPLKDEISRPKDPKKKDRALRRAESRKINPKDHSEEEARATETRHCHDQEDFMTFQNSIYSTTSQIDDIASRDGPEDSMITQSDVIKRRDIDEPEKLTAEECGELVLAVLAQNPAIIIVDAINECDHDEAVRLLNVLQDLIKNSPKGQNNVKLLLSHRKEPFGPFLISPKILVSEIETGEDVGLFIKHQINAAIENGKTTMGSRSWQNVEKWLIENANGSYTFVRTNIDRWSIDSSLNEGDIFDNLQKEPTTLKGSCMETMKNINDMDECNSTAAKNVFKWIMCGRLHPSFEGRRQLSAGEIVSFATRQLEQADGWSLRRILDVCCKLIVHDETRDILCFANDGVHDFFSSSEEFSKNACHTYILRECLHVYLNSDVNDKLDKDSGFFEYATIHWPFHYRELSAEARRNTPMADELQSFLMSPSYYKRLNTGLPRWMAEIRAWCQKQSDPKLVEHSTCEENFECRNSNSELTMLCDSLDRWKYSWAFLASTFGFKELFMETHSHPEVDQKNDKFSTGLHLAAKWGQYDAVKIWLLAIGRNRSVNSIKSEYSIRSEHPNKGQRVSPLYYAVRYGHEKIVNLFLTRDTDDLNVSMLERKYMVIRTIDTPVIVAVRHQQLSVLKLLLEMGSRVDINQKYVVEHSKNETGRSYTVLASAVKKGSEAMVELLLRRKDVLVNAAVQEETLAHKFDYSILSLAIKYNQVKVAKLLLAAKDIKYNPDGGSKWMKSEIVPPIVAAGIHGGMEVLELLLGLPDLDINAVFRNGTALTWACINGNKEIVKRLLSLTNVDVNHKDDRKRTPLIYAAYHEELDIVNLLCQHDRVDVNCKDARGKSALYYAVDEDYLEMVKLLLARDDVIVQDEILWFAVLKGHEAIVKLLLNKGGIHFREGVKTFQKTIPKIAAKGFETALDLLREKKRMDIDGFGHLLCPWDESWRRPQRELFLEEARRVGDITILRHFEFTPNLNAALHPDNSKIRHDMRRLCLLNNGRLGSQSTLRLGETLIQHSEIREEEVSEKHSENGVDEGNEGLDRFDSISRAESSLILGFESPEIRQGLDGEYFTAGKFQRADSFAEDMVSEWLPPLSILDGLKVNSKGLVLDEEGERVGELEQGDVRECAGKRINETGQVFNKYGHVIGKVITLPQATSLELTPLQFLEGFKVNRKGLVLDEEGVKIGELELGNITECAGKKINQFGEVIGIEGNVIGKVKAVPREDLSPLGRSPFLPSSLIFSSPSQLSRTTSRPSMLSSGVNPSLPFTTPPSSTSSHPKPWPHIEELHIPKPGPQSPDLIP